MGARKITDSQDRLSMARRVLLTGGVTGLAAVAGTTFGQAQPASASTGPTDWQNVVADFGAKNDGSADAAGPIQAAINAAAAAPGNGVVYFPAGTYLIRSPLLLLPGVVLLGPHPYAQDYWAKAGAVLTIGTPFSTPSTYPVSAAIAVFDKQSNGSAATAVTQCGICNLDIEGGSSPQGIDGIAAFGPVEALNIRNVALHNIAGNGIAGYRNGSTNPFPDGWNIADVAIVNAGSSPVAANPDTSLNRVAYQADGLQLAGNDHSLENVHSQGSGTAGVNGNGFNIAGSNIRCSRLRADSSGLDGFLWASVVGGGNWSGISFDNCGTQGNNSNGARITNTSSSGQQLNNVAEFRGCRFEGDGKNAGIGGGGFAAIRVEGGNIVTITDCDVLVKTIGVPQGMGSPQWALATGAVGTSPGRPMLVQALGGFWSCFPGGNATQPWNDAAQAGLLSVSVHMYLGTSANPVPTGTTVPVIKQNNPV